MRWGWLCLAMIGAPAFGQDGLIAVPSGQPVTLQDVIWNEPGPDGLTARFRFIAPEIARDTGSIDFETALEDMDHLCETYALPRTLTTTGPRPVQIIVSMSDIPVEFGIITPEATQFFEAYSIAEGICQWEPF